MGQALYRKYRSRSLGEIVGQEHITTTLANALKSGKISHAYLFTGPRGTGKTSIARILAHEINNLPYSQDTHFDIIEIDAASNNSVEDIREMREKVQSAPTSAKYKVYIIDEVHMLSKPAFNALLKTLEEPPEHVIFILATTEVHKLPETIVSRTQRFSFRPVPLEQVIEHLAGIAAEEKIAVDSDALRLIAEHGEGSFRDSISLLDQASASGGKITAAHVEQLLGRAPGVLIDELLEGLTSHNAAGVTTVLRELYDKGYEPAMISLQLGKLMRNSLNTSLPHASLADIMTLLHKLLAVPASHRPAQLLELTLLEYALTAGTGDTQPKVPELPRTETVQETTPAPAPQVDQPATAQAPQANIGTKKADSAPDQPPAEEPARPVPSSTASQAALPPEAADTREDVAELWQQVLQTIKQSHNTLYGIARMAKPMLSGDTLTLATKFAFHQKRLSEARNRDILANCFSNVRGSKTSLACTITDAAVDTADAKGQAKPDVAAISNIFGGAELLD